MIANMFIDKISLQIILLNKYKPELNAGLFRPTGEINDNFRLRKRTKNFQVEI